MNTPENNSSNFCFCTLALGSTYCKFALDLAKDLEKYAPQKKIIIFTNNSKHFERQNNVLVFEHISNTVYNVWDKTYVIEKALSLYENCVYFDADIRIVDYIPSDINFLPGITAYSCFSIKKKYETVFKSPKAKSKNRRLLVHTAKKLNVNLDDVKFAWEYMWMFQRDEKTQDFIDLWRKIGRYYEQRGRYGGEGEAMGLAAAKLGISIHYDYEKSIPFFKYRDVKYKISQGLVKQDTVQEYIDRYKEIKFPQKSFWEKVKDKIDKYVNVQKRLMILRISNLVDFDFYYS
ncbi:MAG: hypothetical protein SWX82_31090 [Cyanobacteriota bacterium]|nr:hypothetical protein [Cyanobacteriota bacterium]